MSSGWKNRGHQGGWGNRSERHRMKKYSVNAQCGIGFESRLEDLITIFDEWSIKATHSTAGFVHFTTNKYSFPIGTVVSYCSGRLGIRIITVWALYGGDMVWWRPKFESGCHYLKSSTRTESAVMMIRVAIWHISRISKVIHAYSL